MAGEFWDAVIAGKMTGLYTFVVALSGAEKP